MIVRSNMLDSPVNKKKIAEKRAERDAEASKPHKKTKK